MKNLRILQKHFTHHLLPSFPNLSIFCNSSLFTRYSLLFTIFILLFSSCNLFQPKEKPFDIQGHRGCRGLMPENTIEGFIKAIDLGVTTLEMDVVITKDKQVLLSHEPFMSSTICFDSLGNEIDLKDEKLWNIYDMTSLQIKKFDCGSKVHPDFPQQEKLAVSKPLLSKVIDTVEKYIQVKKLKPVFYNIEIKGGSKYEEILNMNAQKGATYFPKPKEFAQLLIDVLHEKGIQGRTIIQSFDIFSLREVKQIDPEIPVAQLIHYGNQLSYKLNIQNLSFKPEIYSPEHTKVTPELIAYMKEQGIKVIPWTVNDEDRMQELIQMGVDGIITDYPDRLIVVLKTIKK